MLNFVWPFEGRSSAPVAVGSASDSVAGAQTISSGGQTQAFSALITATFTTDPGETSVDFILGAVGTNDNTIYNFAAVHQVPEPSSTTLLGLSLIMRCRR